MSEKSLQQVGDEASRIYTDHRIDGRALDHEQRILDSMSQKYVSDGPTYRSQAGRVDQLQSAHDDGLSKARAHAEANAEQLHDLAVVEAHLAGVAIKVKEPLTIGETVEEAES